MIYPCCKKDLSAPLDGPALVTCPCGQAYLPEVISTYNEMIDIIIGWRDVLNGKAQVKAEPGEGPFIADLMRRGIEIIVLNEAIEFEETYDCPIHGDMGEIDCPRC